MSKKQQRNVAALSYSSLHEKLGESQRALRVSEVKLKHAEEDLTKAHNDYAEQFDRMMNLHDRLARARRLLITTSMTLVGVIIVLLVFTFNK